MSGNRQTVEFLFKAVADTAGLDKFSGGVKALASSVQASDKDLAEFGRSVLAAGSKLKLSGEVLNAQIGLLKQIQNSATAGGQAYQELGANAATLKRTLTDLETGFRKGVRSVETLGGYIAQLRGEMKSLDLATSQGRAQFAQQSGVVAKLQAELDGLSKSYRRVEGASKAAGQAQNQALVNPSAGLSMSARMAGRTNIPAQQAAAAEAERLAARDRARASGANMQALGDPYAGQSLSQRMRGRPIAAAVSADQAAMAASAQAIKGYRMELAALTATGDKSRDSLQRQAAVWAKLRNAVDPTTKAFREASQGIGVLERRLGKTEQRRFGGGNRFALGQTAGVLAGASIYGGPLGFAGGAAGAVLGGGPAGALIGAQIGAQAGMTAQSLGNMADYAAQIDKLKIGLKAVTANQWEYNRALEIAAISTNSLNVPQEVAIKNVTQLSAAVLAAGGNLKDTENVYLGISSAVKALGGSAEQVDGALLALIQTFSKGRVSAEELNQIGERLPGGFAKFTQATGKGIKDLERGTVGLKDAIKFVELLRKEYEETAKAIGASQQDAGARLQVQINDLRETVGRELGPVGADFQKALADAIPVAKDLLLSLKPVAQLLAEMAKTAIQVAKLLAQAWTGVGKAIQSYVNFITGKRSELNKKPPVIPGSDRISNLPDPKPQAGDDKEARRQRDLAFQLFDLRNELNKRLYENEIDYAKRAAELNKQAIEDVAKLRRDTQEKAQRFLRDNADELVGMQRRGEDLQAQRALQERIIAIRAQGVGEDRNVLEAREQVARDEFELAQQSRDRNRTEADRQRDQTRKLEDFKLEVAKAAGEIQRKYGESYGKLQEEYAISNAKILQTGAENAAKAIETAARNAANELSSVSIGGAAGGGIGGYTDVDMRGRSYGPQIAAAAKKNNIDPRLLYGLVQQESKFSPTARSRAGAYGLTQLMPDTAKELGVNINDIGQQLEGGARYLRQQIDKFGSIEAGLRAYNQGPGNQQLWPGGASREAVEYPGKVLANAARLGFTVSGGSMGGPIGLTGGSPGSRNAGYSSGPHLDVRWADGNPITKADADRFIRVAGKVPSSYGVTSGYGPRSAPVPGASTFHRGIDFGTPANLPITLTGGASFAGSTSASASGGGGLVGIINTPMGQMKLLHLEKILAPAGAAANAAPPREREVYKPTPLPARVNPNDPRFRYDPSDEFAKIRNSGNLLDREAAANAVTEREAELKNIYIAQTAAIREITIAREAAATAGMERYDDELKTYELMRNGITPELAKQFVEIDRAASAERDLLQIRLETYTAQADNQALADDVRANAADIAAFAQEQLNAQQGITTQLRDQAVAAQQLKENPAIIVQDRMSALQDDQRKMMNLGNQAVSVANTIGDSFGDAFQGVITGSKTAQEALAGMFESIAASFAQMAANILANQIQQALLGLIGGALGGGLGGGGLGGGALGVGGFSSGVLGLGAGAFGFAKGGAFGANGIVPFAKGGVVNSPTMFKFAKGGMLQTGVAGEAGPEAILPLSRGAGGRLGVRLEVPKRPSTRGRNSAAAEAEAMATSKPIKVQVESQVINGVEYVTKEQFDSGLRGAVGQAQQATAKSMRTSLRYRRSAGLD
jgi:tape measure domain-containing protein